MIVLNDHAYWVLTVLILSTISNVPVLRASVARDVTRRLTFAQTVPAKMEYVSTNCSFINVSASLAGLVSELKYT